MFFFFFGLALLGWLGLEIKKKLNEKNKRLNKYDHGAHKNDRKRIKSCSVKNDGFKTRAVLHAIRSPCEQRQKRKICAQKNKKKGNLNIIEKKKFKFLEMELGECGIPNQYPFFSLTRHG